MDKMEAAEDKAAQESSRGNFDRGIAKLKEMRGANRAKRERENTFTGFTFESAFGHLCSLFNRFVVCIIGNHASCYFLDCCSVSSQSDSILSVVRHPSIARGGLC